MVVQILHPCWEFHIAVIPCHLAKYLQATSYSFVFILVIFILELDSNWNIMQQVRIHKYKADSCTICAVSYEKRTRKINYQSLDFVLGSVIHVTLVIIHHYFDLILWWQLYKTHLKNSFDQQIFFFHVLVACQSFYIF